MSFLACQNTDGSEFNGVTTQDKIRGNVRVPFAIKAAGTLSETFGIRTI